MWSQRYLTVYGKITIIKSLLLPKFTHLLAALRSPSVESVKKLNRTLFKFLWSGKQDKVSRKSVYMEPYMGGLGMPDINTYVIALKGTNPALKKPSNIPEIYAKMFGRFH